MNVRSIRLKNKRQELAHNCHTQFTSILGVIDHRIVHKEEVLFEQIDQRKLVTTSAWRSENNASLGGVGLMIDRNAENHLAQIKPITNRILVAHFTGNPALTIIIHYSPVEGNEDATMHYELLAAAVKEVPKHNLLIVMGDFNAHLDKSVAKFVFRDKINKNGRLVKNFIQESGLFVANASFQKKPGKLWTFISDMSGAKTQVDFIMVNKKWRNSVKNCEAYNSFNSIGSDHRVVSAGIRLSLRSRKDASKPRFDWNALKTQELQEMYTIKVKNRFAALCNEDESATESYNHFILANDEAAKEIIPLKSRLKKKSASNDQRVIEARENAQLAFKEYAKKPSQENQIKLQYCKEKLQGTYDVIDEENIESMVNDVENYKLTSQCRESWLLINKITGRKAAKQGIIKAKNKEERIEKWYSHFKNLLGKDPITTDETASLMDKVFEKLNIAESPFTTEEFQKVKKSILCNKACGPDGIPPEVFKYCNIDGIILRFANKLLEGEKPKQWSDTELKPLPKTGDLSITDNYRGIALSPIITKLVNKMILNRIRPKLDPLLRYNQNGFRPGRSTTSHILALRRLIEEVKGYNLNAVIVFIDFKKAFDSVHRGKMLNILKAYGIPSKMVDVIALLYSNTRARVITPDGETDWFDIVAGVLQGDTLAPYLFAIVLDYAMRQALLGKEEELGFVLEKRRSRRQLPTVVTDTGFADDIALLSNEISQAQEMLGRLESQASKIGLQLNAKKTEAMVFNQTSNTPLKAKNGTTLKYVENFKYLGSYMASSQNDFEVRKALAWSACHRLKKIWASKLSRQIKIRLFIATVESVWLYGSETWTLTATMKKQLDGCYTRMLRMVLNVSWKQKLTNVQLYQDLPPLSDKVAYRRMKLAGHCVRHEEEVASK